MIKPVEIVEVNRIVPVFKDGQEANSIQVINFKFKDGDECGYNVIARKGLYEIGSKAVYIQPDYCLSDIELFKSFTMPDNDPKKSRLGKNNRIRAIKFNFSFENTTDPIYSFGVMLPKDEVDTFIKMDCDVDDISDILGIIKYEEPDTAGSGLAAGDFPSFIYKTDEENINNLKSKVSNLCDGNTVFGVTIKHDGSSHTTYFKNENDEYKFGVCSRTLEKKLEQKRITGYVDENGNIYHQYINPETKEKGWFCDATNIFKTNNEVSDLTPTFVEVKDTWVDLAFSTGLIENGLKYCKEYGLELAFRGEIFGQGLKGSGNKYNPDANKKQTLRIFGVDDLSTGFSKRLNYSSPHNLETICLVLELDYTKPELITPNSYKELCDFCDAIIAREKNEGRIIEGVVIRTHYTNQISCKYMNPEYDAKK
jgi:hypothetical protein